MEYPQPSSSGTTSYNDRFSNMLNAAKNAASQYSPQSITESVYDTAGSLGDLSNLSDSALANLKSMNRADAIRDNSAARNASNRQNAASAQNGVNSGDTDEDGLLAMIFNIVPIGINIAKKGATIAQGFGEVPTGIGELIANIVLMTVILAIDSFTFIVQLCVYLFKVLICSVDKILNFPKCVVFYFIDVFIFCFIMVIVSILFMIDMIFMVKMWLGISLVQLFMFALGMISKLDALIYEYTDFHVFNYPPVILDMCYNCSAMGDTRGFKMAAKNMFNDLFIQLPSSIGDPIGEIITGFSHIFSFFNLDD